MPFLPPFLSPYNSNLIFLSLHRSNSIQNGKKEKMKSKRQKAKGRKQIEREGKILMSPPKTHETNGLRIVVSKVK